MEWETPRAHSAAVDARAAQQASAAFMSRVYRWMFLGLAITGVTAMATASSELAVGLVARGYVFWVLGMVGFTWAVSASLPRLSASAAGALFIAYSGFLGFVLSVIFLVYQLGSIGRVFFLTAGVFGALSLYGTITKKDLSAWATFLFIGFWGVFGAAMINLFWPNGMLSFVAACMGVIVFAGLAAYDTQKLRALGAVAGGGTASLAVTGALHLYLDFINLFLSLLRLFGRRR